MIARSVPSSCVPDRSIATDTCVYGRSMQGDPWRTSWKHALSLIYEGLTCNGVQVAAPNEVGTSRLASPVFAEWLRGEYGGGRRVWGILCD